MEIILEIIFSFFGELLLQVIIEFCAHIGFAHLHEKYKERAKPSGCLLIIAYAILGSLGACVSLLIFPEGFLEKGSALAVANLVITPILAASAMCLIGAYRAKKDKPPLLIDTFLYAYTFAMVLALGRFIFCST